MEKEELPFEIKKIGHLYTALYNLPDGRPVAAPILPAETEYEYSSSRSLVTAKGQLVRDPEMTYFIKPPTYWELTNATYRKAARANKRNITYHGAMTVMSSWMRIAAQQGAKVLRLFYGGDPYGKFYALRRLEVDWHAGWYDMFWHNVAAGKLLLLPFNILSGLSDKADQQAMMEWAERKDRPRDIELHLWTANTEKVNLFAKTYYDQRDFDHLITFISEAQSYRDLPLYGAHRVIYQWAHELEEAVTEFDVCPNKDLDPVGMGTEEWRVAIPDGAYKLWKDAAVRK